MINIKEISDIFCASLVFFRGQKSNALISRNYGAIYGADGCPFFKRNRIATRVLSELAHSSHRVFHILACEIWYILPFSTVYPSFSRRGKTGNETRQRDVASPLINPSLSVLEKTHEKLSLSHFPPETRILRSRDWKSLSLSLSILA